MLCVFASVSGCYTLQVVNILFMAPCRKRVGCSVVAWKHVAMFYVTAHFATSMCKYNQSLRLCMDFFFLWKHLYMCSM